MAPCRETGRGQEQTRAAMDKQWAQEQAGVAKPGAVFPGLRETITSVFYRWETEAQWKGSSEAASLLERNLLEKEVKRCFF